MFINQKLTNLSNLASYSVKTKFLHSWLLQVFSNKPVASDKNAVFVVQVDMFAGVIWIV